MTISTDELIHATVRRQTSIEQILRLAPAEGDTAPRDLASLDIPRRHLTRLTQQGILNRSGRGIYFLANADVTENHSLAEACKRLCRVA